MTLDDLQNAPFTFFETASQLRDHIRARSLRHFAAGDAARDALKSDETISERQRILRQFFVNAFGELPDCKTPLHAKTTGTVDAGSFRIEKVIFESRPQEYVTGLLYLPHEISARQGAVLFVCGHHPTGKQVEEYQRVCQTLVGAGLIVFAVDPPGQGERLAYYSQKDGKPIIPAAVAEHDHAGAQCVPLGDNLARYFLHDNIRALDYLCARPEVDPARIGVTGNSGGGTQTAVLMMAEPRVAAAAPGTFIMNRELFQYAGLPQDAEQIWPGFTAAGFDHEDILLAMAPRPVMVLAVTADFFPIEATRKTVEKSRRFWEITGNPGGLELVEDESLHHYTPKLARAAAAFFARHLLAKEDTREFAEPRPFPENFLNVTASGQVSVDFPDAKFTRHANAARLEQISVQPAEKRHQAAAAEISRRVNYERVQCSPQVRSYDKGSMRDLSYEKLFWFSQPDLVNHGILFRGDSGGDGQLPLTIAIWENGTRALSAHEEFLRAECANGRTVLVLDVSGEGACACHPFLGGVDNRHFDSALRKMADDLVFLGDDLAALRAHQVIFALDALETQSGVDPSATVVYAESYHASHAFLAALVDTRIKSARRDDPETTYSAFLKSEYYRTRDIKSFLVRGILRFCDLDEIERWVNTRGH